MKISVVRAIVSGGASGLGEAVVRAIISKGGKAAILDLDDEKGKKIEKEFGESASYQKTDVYSEGDVSSAIQDTVKKFGKINVAVNCAGITIAGKTSGKNGPMPLPIARGLASLGIRNVTIAPGLFDTPMMASLPEEVRKSLGQSVPFPSR